MIVARAALAARDYPAARKAMAPLVAEGERPSVRACLIMAELEDAEFGNQGQVREWLARSARAPRDPAWIADGVASKHWAPVSPVTGRLDAFVWQKPAERLGADLGADVAAADWVRHSALPARPAAEPAPVIEARVLATPEKPVPTAATPLEAAAASFSRAASSTSGDPPAQTSAAEARSASTSRARAQRPAQKVVFPLAAAPDDPGTEAEGESAEIRRMGHL